MCEHEWLGDIIPIGVEPNSDAINGMWMGDRIAELKGYDLSNKNDLLNWLEAVTEIHDKFVEQFIAPNFDSIEPLELPTNPLVRWRIIRESVAIAVAQFPVTSIIDVITKFGLTLDEFMTAMSTDRFERTITVDEFLAFEADMLKLRPNYMSIVRKHNISRNMVRSFKKLYEPMVIRQHGQGNNMGFVKKEFHEMILARELSDKEILKTIKDKYNIEYTQDAIYYYRRTHGTV
jgi:hypothetical protein